MKTLLTILLFIGCMNVNSQDLIESLAENLLLRNDLSVLKAELYRKLDEQSKEMSTRVIKIGQPDTSVYYQKGVFRSYTDINLQMLLDYQTECYNDSTLEHTQWGDFCVTLKGNLANGEKFVLTCEDKSHFTWTHKEPTFQGFIEYMKSKNP